MYTQAEFKGRDVLFMVSKEKLKALLCCRLGTKNHKNGSEMRKLWSPKKQGGQKVEKEDFRTLGTR